MPHQTSLKISDELNSFLSTLPHGWKTLLLSTYLEHLRTYCKSKMNYPKLSRLLDGDYLEFAHEIARAKRNHIQVPSSREDGEGFSNAEQED